MSSHVPTPGSATPHHASTSANPAAVTPASYHPAPRPVPNTFPFHRIDTHQIKQQLHDALGEAGLPYWKALNAYLLGQLGRHELEALVRGWLKGKNIQLHNHLLASLLHNASAPQYHNVPLSPLNMHKRRKGEMGIEAPDFDSDATFIEPHQRVQYWVMGMGGRERDRVRRAMEPGDEENAEVAAAPAPEVAAAPADAEWDANGRKRSWSVFNSGSEFAATHAPLAQSSRTIPSSRQLGVRMSQVAKIAGLDVSPEATRDVGEFMGVGLNAHLGDVLHSVVHLTGRDRPGAETIRVPLGVKTNTVNGATEKPLPPPSLATMQYLFTLAPSLHPQQSPTLYKLEGSITQAELDSSTPPVKPPSSTRPALLPLAMTTPAQPTAALPPMPMSMTQPGASPVAGTAALHAPGGQAMTPGGSKMDSMSQTLVNTGLLKIDKAGHNEGEGGADRKREKKHNLHWKYEDPALILKDLLG